MALKTINLQKLESYIGFNPKIEFTAGEDVEFRMLDSDNDLDGKTIYLSIKEGSAMFGQSINVNPEILQEKTRKLQVINSVAKWNLSNKETRNLKTNKIYTLQIVVGLPNFLRYVYGTYNLQIKENIVSGLPEFSLSFYQPYLLLEPDDLTTLSFIAGTTNVSQIRDKSGNNLHFEQTNQAQCPLSLNGMLNFDGVNDVLTRPSLVESVFTKFFVLDLASPSGFIYESANAVYLYGTSGSTVEVRKGTAVNLKNHSSNWATNAPNPKIVCLEYNGTNAGLTMSINGGENVFPPLTQTDAGNAAITSGLVTLGGRMAASLLPSKGNFGKIVFFNRVISTQEKSEITNFLKEYYKIP